jgi:hypothetical protein
MLVADSHRFNVNFSDAAYRDLNTLAERKGKTMSEVLRDAIALERWFDDARSSGSKVLVEQPDGRIREVVPRELVLGAWGPKWSPARPMRR